MQYGKKNYIHVLRAERDRKKMKKICSNMNRATDKCVKPAF